MKVTDKALLDLIEADYRSSRACIGSNGGSTNILSVGSGIKPTWKLMTYWPLGKLANFRLRYFPIIIRWIMNR